MHAPVVLPAPDRGHGCYLSPLGQHDLPNPDGFLFLNWNPLCGLSGADSPAFHLMGRVLLSNNRGHTITPLRYTSSGSAHSRRKLVCRITTMNILTIFSFFSSPGPSTKDENLPPSPLPETQKKVTIPIRKRVGWTVPPKGREDEGSPFVKFSQLLCWKIIHRQNRPKSQTQGRGQFQP